MTELWKIPPVTIGWLCILGCTMMIDSFELLLISGPIIVVGFFYTLHRVLR